MRSIAPFPAPKSPDEALWTKRQAAKYLRISDKTLDRWRKLGAGPKARKIGSQVRYFPQDVIDWVHNSAPEQAGMPIPKR